MANLEKNPLNEIVKSLTDKGVNLARTETLTLSPDQARAVLFMVGQGATNQDLNSPELSEKKLQLMEQLQARISDGENTVPIQMGYLDVMVLNFCVVNLTRPALQNILNVLKGAAGNQTESTMLLKDPAQGLLFLIGQDFEADAEVKNQFMQELLKHIRSGDEPFLINLDSGKKLLIAMGILNFMGILQSLVEGAGLNP
ncbi:hypothetical protein CEB3_c18950 [Peptococcaceae bacterium CEB3]|nr:hypothetical protein CEB3_c18950 [Peptococcaceae bacterium CEB3]